MPDEKKSQRNCKKHFLRVVSTNKKALLLQSFLIWPLESTFDGSSGLNTLKSFILLSWVKKKKSPHYHEAHILNQQNINNNKISYLITARNLSCPYADASCSCKPFETAVDCRLKIVGVIAAVLILPRLSY